MTGTVLGAGHTVDNKNRNGPYSHGIYQSSPIHSIIESIPKYKVYWLRFVLCACYSRLEREWSLPSTGERNANITVTRYNLSAIKIQSG